MALAVTTTTSSSREAISLSNLPDELIHEIFECLDAQSLITCKSVARRLLNLVTNSTALTYTIELFAANLIDNPYCLLSRTERLRRLVAHQRAWNNAFSFNLYDIPILNGEPSFALGFRAWELTSGTFGIAKSHNLRFIQLPSQLRGIEQYEWAFHAFPYRIRDFATDRSQDLLVVVEREIILEDEDYLRVHLHSLSTGREHPLARQAIISTRLLSSNVDPDWHAVHIFKGHIAIMVQVDNLGTWTHCELVVLDWQSGIVKHTLLGRINSFSFLSEQWLLLAVLRAQANAAAEDLSAITFEVIDLTHAPASLNIAALPSFLAKCPAFDWWTFEFPSLYSLSDPERSTVCIRTDYSPCITSGDIPFTTSPSDRLLVITIQNIPRLRDLVLFIRLSSFHSLIAGTRNTYHSFPWGEWGSAHTRVVNGSLPPTWFCYVHGLKAIFPEDDEDFPKVSIWDFNQVALRRQRAILPGRNRKKQLSSDLCTPTLLIDSTSVDGSKDSRLFGEELVTSLPCCIRTFPSPTHRRDQEYMMAEDCLVLVEDGNLVIFSI